MLLTNGFKTDMIAILNEKAKALSIEKQKLLEQINELESQENDIISIIDLSQK